MKKLKIILSISALTLAMFFNTNLLNKENVDFNLASLFTLNTASANGECLRQGSVKHETKDYPYGYQYMNGDICPGCNDIEMICELIYVSNPCAPYTVPCEEVEANWYDSCYDYLCM